MSKFYKFFLDSDKALNEDKAFQYLVTNKFDITPTSPKNLAKEIDWYSMQEALNYQDFIPGMFYTFKYTSKVPVISGKSEFIDEIPLSLCIGKTQDSMLGFNFNLILNDTRAHILDKLYEYDKEFFEKTLPEALKKKQPVVSQELLKLFVDKGKRNAFINWMNINFKIPSESFAYRRYDKRFIENVHLIDYWEWKWIPFLNFDKSVRGKSLREIQLDNAVANS